MIGTLLNIFTVLIGGGLGALLGARLPERLRETILWGLGLFIIAIGVKMTLDSQNALITLGSVVLGGVLGEWWQIEAGLSRMGAWLEARFGRLGGRGSAADAEGPARFIKGFVSASLVFCVGPLSILGSLQDGLTGDFQLLAIKSVLDGFAALAFAASLGIGVLFSTIVILFYQGALTLLAGQAQSVLTPAMIAEMTAAGGLLIMGIGFGTLLELKPIRVANYLPALAIAPLIVVGLRLLGIEGF